MCDNCYDADSKEQLIKFTSCDGNIIPFLSVSDLKLRIQEKWGTSGKTNYRVFSQAMLENVGKELSWVAATAKGSVQMHVDFL